jgi:hypothetical protein
MIGPSSTWILSLIIAFGPEPWSNCTCMMLTQSPCLCGIFLRPRSVAIAVPWHIAWCPVLSSVQELNQDSSQLPKLARSQIPVCLSFLDKYVFELFCRRNEGIMVDRLTRDRGHLCSVSVATKLFWTRSESD